MLLVSNCLRSPTPAPTHWPWRSFIAPHSIESAIQFDNQRPFAFAIFNYQGSTLLWRRVKVRLLTTPKCLRKVKKAIVQLPHSASYTEWTITFAVLNFRGFCGAICISLVPQNLDESSKVQGNWCTEITSLLQWFMRFHSWQVLTSELSTTISTLPLASIHADHEEECRLVWTKTTKWHG